MTCFSASWPTSLKITAGRPYLNSHSRGRKRLIHYHNRLAPPSDVLLFGLLADIFEFNGREAVFKSSLPWTLATFSLNKKKDTISRAPFACVPSDTHSLLLKCFANASQVAVDYGFHSPQSLLNNFPPPNFFQMADFYSPNH